MPEYKIIEIFTSEEARWQGKPLSDAIVRYVANLKVAARCMVLKGTEGCFETGEVSTRRLEVLSYNMPVTVLVILPAVEYPQAINQIETMVTNGIVTVRSPQVVSHRTRNRLIPKHLRVRDAMTSKPEKVTPMTGVDQVAGLLLSSVFTGVPVVDENDRPLGIITQGDLIYKAGMPARIGILAQSGQQDKAAVLRTLSRITAREIMTSPPAAIEEDRMLTEAVAAMLDKGLKRLPVVDVSGRLSGMLSRVDIFRTIMRESPDWKAFQAQEIEVENIHFVSEIMRRDIHAVKPDTPIEEVVRTIDVNGIQHVAVVGEDGAFLGLISERNLLAAFVDREEGIRGYLARRIPFGWRSRKLREIWQRIEQKNASEIMDPDVVTIHEDASLDDAIRIMIEKSLKRLPVVDSDHRFRGMITRDALLRTAFAQLQ